MEWEWGLGNLFLLDSCSKKNLAGKVGKGFTTVFFGKTYSKYSIFVTGTLGFGTFFLGWGFGCSFFLLRSSFFSISFSYLEVLLAFLSFLIVSILSFTKSFFDLGVGYNSSSNSKKSFLGGTSFCSSRYSLRFISLVIIKLSSFFFCSSSWSLIISWTILFSTVLLSTNKRPLVFFFLRSTLFCFLALLQYNSHTI